MNMNLNPNPVGLLVIYFGKIPSGDVVGFVFVIIYFSFFN